MYSREIDGKILTLAASGWTYDDTFVLYDHETESLWYPKKNSDGLTCIAGEYADRFLPGIDSVRMRWNKWRAQTPDTKIMACRSVPPGVCVNYIK